MQKRLHVKTLTHDSELLHGVPGPRHFELSLPQIRHHLPQPTRDKELVLAVQLGFEATLGGNRKEGGEVHIDGDVCLAGFEQRIRAEVVAPVGPQCSVAAARFQLLNGAAVVNERNQPGVEPVYRPM